MRSCLSRTHLPSHDPAVYVQGSSARRSSAQLPSIQEILLRQSGARQDKEEVEQQGSSAQGAASRQVGRWQVF